MERTFDLLSDHEAATLFGLHDEHLRLIEAEFGVKMISRGRQLTVSGPEAAVEKVGHLLDQLLGLIRSGQYLRRHEVVYAIRAMEKDSGVDLSPIYTDRIEVLSKRQFVTPKTAGQKVYVDAIRRHDIVFAIGVAGTGKCVAGSTLILTSQGLLPIESLGRETEPDTYTPIDIQVAGMDGSEPASHFYNGGRSPTRRIRTRCGFEIEATPEHPLLRLGPDGEAHWTQACDLQQGDFIAVQRNQRMFGQKTAIQFEYRRNGPQDHSKAISLAQLDKEFAYFMGILTGDGCLTFLNRVILSTADQEIAAHFCEMARQLGLHVFRNGGEKGRRYDWIIASSQLYQSLLHLGMSSGLAGTKQIPSAILQAPEECVIAFLQGLFDTDGSADKRDGYIEFVSASERLADEVHLLLLNIGVLANKRCKWIWYRDHKRPYHLLDIRGSEAVRFYEEVGFRLARKQNRRQEKSRNTNVDLVPNVDRLIQAATNGVVLPRRAHSVFQDYKRGRRLPSYPALGEIVAVLDEFSAPEIAVSKLKKLQEHRFFWAEIEKITDGESDVYDLTVPGSHSFCANGFVNHNSYLAVAMAVNALKRQEVSRIILTRPAVEAGESLGFLPGTFEEKVNPYLRPLYDALYEMMDVDKIQRSLEKGVLEVAPLAYMRGRAQPHFSSVLTPRGYVPIGSLQAGDTVVGANGAPTRVVGVYPQGRREIFRVTMQDGGSALCCAEHLWAVYTREDRRRNKGFRILETREMLERLRCAHYHRFESPLISAPVQFPSRPVPMDPYALGLLLGDGCLTGKTTPSFTTSDVELAHALGETLEGVEMTRKSSVDYVLRNADGGRGGVVVANPVTAVLRDLSLCGARSSTKFVPETYLYNLADVRLAVLQGLLDTDGGPVVQAGRTCRIHYCTTSMRLRDDVIFLVRSLGGIVYSRIRAAKGRSPGRARGREVRHVSDAYILDIRLPESIQPFRLSRKLQRYQQVGGGHPARYIDRIERIGEHDAICIRVDAPNSLYVTDNFIVTHNTLNDSFVILDEAQNCTPEQMKMFLTRLGFDSKTVITGDVTQSDLPQGKISGLAQARDVLKGVEGIGFVEFNEGDVVRHELVQKIIKAYDRANGKVSL